MSITGASRKQAGLYYDKGGWLFNAAHPDYGVGLRGSGRIVIDGAITSGLQVFTSATAGFTSADVGKSIWVAGAGAAGVTLLTTIQSLTNSTTVVLAAAASTTVAGAITTYGYDESTAINAAITDAAVAGFTGPVGIPGGGRYLIDASLALADSSRLIGAVGPQAFTTLSSCVLQATPKLAAPVIELGSHVNCTMEGLVVRGAGAVSGQKGIHGAGCNGFNLEGLSVLNFGDQGIHINGSAGGVLRNINASGNCLVRTGRAAFLGGVDLTAVDILVSDIYSDCAVGTGVASTGLIGGGFIAGIYTNCQVSQFINCEADLGQVGFVVAGSQNRISNCRSNLTQGRGWVVSGFQNQFSNNISMNASLDTAATYDGWDIASTATGNLFMGNVVGSTNAGQVRYGFNDATAPNNVETTYNHYIGNKALGTTLANELYHFVGNRCEVTQAYRSQTQGDVSITVQCDVDAAVQHFNTALTANRTVALSGTGARNGWTFRIVRTTAASGASTLTITGGNVSKVLALGQWADYIYSGHSSAWMLSAFGSL